MTGIAMPSAVDRSMARYLERQRALGRAYRTEEDVLRSLCRSLALTGSTDLDLAAFDR